MPILDDATLVAYVDGELDASTAREVERSLADDPQKRKLVRDLMETSTLLRAAFSSSLHEPVPEALIDSIRQATGTAEAPRGIARLMGAAVPRRIRREYAMAATILALAVGLGGGYLASVEIGTPGALRTERVLAAFQLEAGHLRNRALEYEVSGKTLSWQDAQSGAQVSVTPMRTYRTAAGGFCREYREERTFGSRREIEQGLSCRAADRQWVPRRVVIETAKPSI